jgi:methionyl-tRNA synthetase
MSRFYITTPIYYVNDLPHIGHVYTTVAADTFARYRRLLGHDVYFLTGTDEHGQKIEQAAREGGIAPLELADRVVERYHELWRRLDISHDDFIRTTEERHKRGVREVIRRIDAAGDFYTARHEGWYCPACEAFYTEKELLPGGLCPDHRRPLEWKSEDNVFFRLSKYQQALLDWFDRDRPVRPPTRANEIRRFVESGLRDLSVSRTAVEWGIPFPEHPGHVTYVWLDALTNYVSALGLGAATTDPAGGGGELYRRFWGGSDERDVRLHLIGKDILRFHAVYWPAFLMSAGLPLPTTVYAHGWWLRDDRKISKSVGNVPRPDELIEQLGPDPVRWFLLREMVFGQDASYSDEAVVDRYNGDLANGLGNTMSRLVTLSRRSFDGRTPTRPPTAGPLADSARRAATDYRLAMDAFEPHRALEALWRLLADVNQHVVTHQPWKLAGDDTQRDLLAAVLWDGLEALRIVAVGLQPAMPQTAARVLRGLGATPAESLDAMEWGGLLAGAELPAVQALFPRADKAALLAGGQGAGASASAAATAGGAPAAVSAPAPPPAAPPPAADAQRPDAPPREPVAAATAPTSPPNQEKRMAISIDDFMGVELKVARVLAAEEIPKSSKLVKLSVDLGDEQRTIVAGIRKSYAPEQLVGRQIVIVANLQPAKLMGVESQGMVLAASLDGEAVLLQPEREVAPGTRVR